MVNSIPPTSQLPPAEWVFPQVHESSCYDNFQYCLRSTSGWMWYAINIPFGKDCCEIFGRTLDKIIFFIPAVLLFLISYSLEALSNLVLCCTLFPKSDDTQSVVMIDEQTALINKTNDLVKCSIENDHVTLTLCEHSLFSPGNQGIFKITLRQDKKTSVTVEPIRESPLAMRLTIDRTQGLASAEQEVLFIDTSYEIPVAAERLAYKLYNYCPKPRSIQTAAKLLAPLYAENTDLRATVIAVAQSGLAVACSGIGNFPFDLRIVTPLNTCIHLGKALSSYQWNYHMLDMQWQDGVVTIDGLAARIIPSHLVSMHVILPTIIDALDPMTKELCAIIAEYAPMHPEEAPVNHPSPSGHAIA